MSNTNDEGDEPDDRKERLNRFAQRFDDVDENENEAEDDENEDDGLPPWKSAGDISEYMDGPEDSETEKKADTANTAETAKTDQTTETAETADPAENAESAEPAETAEPSVKERRNVNMYLPEDDRNELMATFDELNAKAKREGDELEKNRDFYPRVIRAGLDQIAEMDLKEFREL